MDAYISVVDKRRYICNFTKSFNCVHLFSSKSANLHRVGAAVK